MPRRDGSILMREEVINLFIGQLEAMRNTFILEGNNLSEECYDLITSLEAEKSRHD